MTDLIEEFHRVAAQTDTHVGQLFEETVRKIYEAWLKPGDLAVDVGAHKGRHMWPMTRAVGPTGKVIAFEPIGKLCKALRKQVKTRGVRNIKLFELALSDKRGTARFSYFETMPAYSGLRRRITPFDDEEGGLVSIEVRRAMLDDKLPWFRRVSCIKLDIEGGELHALMGGRRCLKKSRPLVIFESGRAGSAEVYDYGADDFFGFFEAMNMRLFWLSGEPFERDQWQANRACWEFVALPEENAGFARKLPTLCRAVLSETLENARHRQPA